VLGTDLLRQVPVADDKYPPDAMRRRSMQANLRADPYGRGAIRQERRQPPYRQHSAVWSVPPPSAAWRTPAWLIVNV
jgi:hypothetical protein